MTQLTNSQRKYLKQLAHHLSPLVQVGKGGLSPQLVQSLDQALVAHELVKVKFVAHKDEKRQIGERLAEETHAELVTIIGHVAVYYRQNSRPEDRRIAVPVG